MWSFGVGVDRYLGLAAISHELSLVKDSQFVGDCLIFWIITLFESINDVLEDSGTDLSALSLHNCSCVELIWSFENVDSKLVASLSCKGL
jgi:hypothetical protein